MKDEKSFASVASVAAPSDTDTGSPRPFPWDVLPPTLLDVVDAVADWLQVPHALPACCALAAASAAIGSGLRIRTDGKRTLRGNIYVIAGVASGSGKTETFNTLLEPVFECQGRLDEEANSSRWVGEVDRIVLSEQAKKLKAELIRQNATGQEASELKQRLAALLEKQAGLATGPDRLVCDDSTGAALEKLLSRRAMFSASDEAGTAILGNLLGRFTGKCDEGIYVRAYSGGYHGGVDRIARESVRLADPCLTILWLMQPSKLDTLFSQRQFREDGLLARVLACRIETHPQKHDSHFSDDYRRIAHQDWHKLWLELYETYHHRAHHPHVLTLTPQAVARMSDYHDETLEGRQHNFWDMDNFAARWVEQAWRLAVVLHAARHGRQAYLKRVCRDDTIDAAIEIARWFAEQQLALLAFTRAAEAEARERKVMELLLSQLTRAEPRDWVTTRDLIMSRVVATSREAQELLRSMEAASRLVCESYRPAHGGHTEKRYRARR